MLVLIRYKKERGFKALEAHGLECTPYPGGVVVELYTPMGSVVLEAEGDAEELAKAILNDLLSEDDYVTQVVVNDVVSERWR